MLTRILIIRTSLFVGSALSGALFIARADQVTTASSAASIAPRGDVKAEDSTEMQSKGSDLYTQQFGPFKFSAGPTSSGSFGVNLDGKGEKDWSLNNIQMVEKQSKLWFPMFGSVGYSADGTWTSDPKSPSNGSLSLKPGFFGGLFDGAYIPGDPAQCGPRPPSCGTPSVFPSPVLGTGAYVDLQYRYGTIQQSTALEKVNQFNAGVGLFIVGPPTLSNDYVSFAASPRLSLTYYHPVDTTGGVLALPTGITANNLQTEFHTTLGIMKKGAYNSGAENYPFKLDLTYNGTKPLSGSTQQVQNLFKVQLSTALIKANNVYPSITYQSGKQGGFAYDKQVIIGALVQFLEPAQKATK